MLQDTKLKDGTPAVQSGIHFNWKIPVTLETAWMLRAWILRELATHATTVPWAEEWAEMYDPCVFKDNGLRMVYSRKAVPCPTCNGKSFKPAAERSDIGEACSECKNVGKIDQGRPYSLKFVFDPSGNCDAKKTEYFKSIMNIAELVERCSIRAVPTVEAVSITGIVTTEIERWALSDRKAIKGANRKVGVVIKGQTVRKHDDISELAPDTKEFKAVAAYIVSEFQGEPIATHVK
jgi:hypothetical protein